MQLSPPLSLFLSLSDSVFLGTLFSLAACLSEMPLSLTSVRALSISSWDQLRNLTPFIDDMVDLESEKKINERTFS